MNNIDVLCLDATEILIKYERLGRLYFNIQEKENHLKCFIFFKRNHVVLINLLIDREHITKQMIYEQNLLNSDDYGYHAFNCIGLDDFKKTLINQMSR